MWHSSFDISSPDSILLEEIKNGNPKAFDVIFKKYYNNLCRFAFFLIHDADMSQCLVQNVFIKLWERRFVSEPIKNVAAYLTSMVKNQCSDYLKEQRIRDLTLQKNNINEPDNSTEEEIFSRNFEECLVIALSKLPPRCRLAFEFSRFENLTNKEIAEKMDISVKGVEALIGRSLKTLRFELKEFLPSFDSRNINPVLFFLKIPQKYFMARKNSSFLSF